MKSWRACFTMAKTFGRVAARVLEGGAGGGVGVACTPRCIQRSPTRNLGLLWCEVVHPPGCFWRVRWEVARLSWLRWWLAAVVHRDDLTRGGDDCYIIVRVTEYTYVQERHDLS